MVETKRFSPENQLVVKALEKLAQKEKKSTPPPDPAAKTEARETFLKKAENPK